MSIEKEAREQSKVLGFNGLLVHDKVVIKSNSKTYRKVARNISKYSAVQTYDVLAMQLEKIQIRMYHDKQPLYIWVSVYDVRRVK